MHLNLYLNFVYNLNMKYFLGKLIPVFNIQSFNSAFENAVAKYGSSKDQLFWWNDNVYTTEKR